MVNSNKKIYYQFTIYFPTYIFSNILSSEYTCISFLTITMSLIWLSNFRLHLTTTWPLLIYAITWVTALTFTVAVASFSPEVAFVSAITPFSSFSQKCKGKSDVRVPLDLPGDMLCFPAQFFTKSNIDLIVPPIFAALIVTASACVVRAAALWELD